MVQTGLETSGLSSKYWSDDLLHAAYIKNHLPHSHFDHKGTPYKKLTDSPPDLSKLRIFGSRIVTRKPGIRNTKLSKHSYPGIFLRYAKTMRNIVYLDTTTNQIKTTTYATFDKAHFSHDNKPPGAKILIELGLSQISYLNQHMQIHQHNLSSSKSTLKLLSGRKEVREQQVMTYTVYRNVRFLLRMWRL